MKGIIMSKKETVYKKLSEQVFERKANLMARQYVDIRECMKCGNPTIRGYCCTYCHDTNPEYRKSEESDD